MNHRIFRYGEPVLREVGAPVTVFDAELVSLAREMVETMNHAEGIGLAAQQIGIARQICVVDVSPVSEPGDIARLDGKPVPLALLMPLVLINPAISDPGGDRVPYNEGCLSFPGINLDVYRPTTITVKYQDTDGAPHDLRCDGILSRCIQHEVDHLNGILFIDRAEPTGTSSIRSRLRRLERDTRTRSD